MAKFNFNLQKVLDYRRQIEEQARLNLARAFSELSKKQRELKKIEQSLSSISAEFSQGNLSTELIWLYKQTEKSLLNDQKRVHREIEEVLFRIDVLKKDLLSKTIERKKLEKLEDKAKKRFVYEEQKKEQKQIDEISTIRYEEPFK